jgi:hypothetical protein
MFCSENKGNKKGRNPSKETDLNLCMAQKVLADTNIIINVFHAAKIRKTVQIHKEYKENF